MKKILLIFLTLAFAISIVNAQKGINFNRLYGAGGGKLRMAVDSSAKNIFSTGAPNQPHTTFNYLPGVNNVSIEINFRKNINIQHYRYTILVDNKPIALNKMIDLAQLKDTHAEGDEEIFSTTTLGIFPVKDKTITILIYSLEKPQDIDKCIFYGKPIPKAKIQAFSKLTKVDQGVNYSWVKDPKARTNFTFSEKDLEITLVKDISDIDYIYNTSIRDKQTNKIIFESTIWKYGGISSEDHEYLPYIDIDKNIFKKSGEYEIIIQPSIKWTNCLDCNISPKEIEKYVTRHTLSITLEEETYTKKELLIYTLIVAFSIGLVFLTILYFIKRRNKKKTV